MAVIVDEVLLPRPRASLKSTSYGLRIFSAQDSFAWAFPLGAGVFQFALFGGLALSEALRTLTDEVVFSVSLIILLVTVMNAWVRWSSFVILDLSYEVRTEVESAVNWWACLDEPLRSRARPLYESLFEMARAAAIDHSLYRVEIRERSELLRKFADRQRDVDVRRRLSGISAGSPLGADDVEAARAYLAALDDLEGR